MSKWQPIALLCLALSTYPWRAYAQEQASGSQTAIAMTGTPKYGEGFDHFAYVNPDAPQGGKLRLGVVGSFDSLNPFIVRGSVPQAPAFSLFSSAAVYESLMARSWDEPFSLYGLIAQKVEVPPDRSWVIFTLDPRAHWNDGVPLTADDVLFSFNTLREKGRPNHRTYYKKVEKAEKLDASHIRFTFKPNPDGSWDREMPLIMGLMPLLPEHDWKDRDFNQTTLRPPVASGPYKITKVEAGRSLTLTRDPSYWGKDLPVQKGMNNFGEVRIDYYRDDSIALQAFKAGAFDLRREADPKKWAKAYNGHAVTDGRIKLERFAHARTEAATGLILNTRRPLFQDKALRKAMNLAFDFGWINRTLFQGLYKRTESFFPNAELAAGAGPAEGDVKTILEKYKDRLPLSFFTESVTPMPTDGTEAARREALLKAATLLETAGYRLKNERLFSPQNEPVSFEVMLSDPAEEKVALEWSRDLKRLGITARIRTVDSAQYQARLNSFDYDVTTGRWFNSLSPGNEQLFFWSCAAAKQKGSRNYAGICDPIVDALAAAIPATQSREELVATTRALDRVLMEGNYTVPFYHLGVDQVASWTTRLGHPTTTPIYGPILESWWAKQGE
ncbi:MAG: extracellular solute-binding protein [Alphaproteobacteria bacterium]|nr:extracellular solute-binding protein [Alphaproteobacteria bacterium]